MVTAIFSAYRRAYAGLPAATWLLTVASLINRCGTMVLPFMAVYLTEAHGFSNQAAANVVACYGIGGVAGAWLGGMAADRFNPKLVHVVSLIANGAGFFVIGHIVDPTSILVAMVALGIVSEAMRPAAQMLVAQMTPVSDRARAVALSRLAANLGMAIGPVIGGVIAEHHAFGLLFTLDGATSMAAAVVMFFGLPSGHAEHARHKSSLADGTRRRVRSDGPFLALCGLMFLVSCVLFQLFSTYPLYLTQVRHMRKDTVGYVLAANPALIVLFEMLIVHGLKGRNPLRVAMIGAGLFCGGFAMTGFADGVVALLASILMWTAGEILFLPPIGGFVSTRASLGRTGEYMGTYTVAFQAASVLAPEIGVGIWERWSAQALWLSCGVAGAIVIVGLIFIDARVKAEAPSTPAS